MESIQRLLDVIAARNLLVTAEHLVLTQVLVPSTLNQLAFVLGALSAGSLVSARVRRWGEERLPRDKARSWSTRVWTRIVEIAAGPGISVALVLGALVVVRTADWPAGVLTMAAQLIAAWIVAALLSPLVRSAFWARAFFVFAFSVAALSVLGLLETTIVRLDQSVVRLGTVQLSALDVIRGVVQFAVLLWLALTASRLLEDQLERADTVSPSLRVLIGKLLRFALVAVAIVMALASVGVDLTAFALFTGALGVAIGFGMQKSTSNLISGLLLLMDRSIKPGDVLELSDPNNRNVQLFGWVTSLNARYVSLTTRDGTEWLVPNDELISNRIVNWSYSHNRVRLLTPINVSFDCDVRLAMELAASAARETPRVMHDPEPVCRLMGFQESVVNLEMRFWIEDPSNGIINVRSDVLLKIWERFRENDIRTPRGHRELVVKPGSFIAVRVENEASLQSENSPSRQGPDHP
ncbi:MAG: mechanosensitive ion channel domain-containing protein [Pseudomonadota bacterium]